MLGDDHAIPGKTHRRQSGIPPARNQPLCRSDGGGDRYYLCIYAEIRIVADCRVQRDGLQTIRAVQYGQWLAFGQEYIRDFHAQLVLRHTHHMDGTDMGRTNQQAVGPSQRTSYQRRVKLCIEKAFARDRRARQIVL